MGVRWKRHSKAVIATQRWRAIRQIVLRRDNYKCVICGAVGRLEIDHIKPVRDCPELSYDIDNCQALCVSCHSAKTRAEVFGKPENPERIKWRLFMKSPDFNKT
jgi:5-methylcytosine-specific restriction enzyme A